MKYIFIVSAILSVCLVSAGILGAYKYEYPKGVVCAAVSFFWVITFIAGIVLIFIPDFFAR